MSESTPVVNKHHGIPFDIYIGRGSRWGNPFPIRGADDREAVIRKYESYLRGSEALLDSLDELAGRSLGCFCAPAPCHGDILAAFADSIRSTGSVPSHSISDMIFTEPKRPRLSFG